jgi:hypothetical protein
MNARDDDDALDRAAARAGEKVLRPLAERLEETAEDDAAYATVQADALTTVRRLSAPLTKEERSILEELSVWAGKSQDKADGKFAALQAHGRR